MPTVEPAEVPSRPLLRHLLCDVATLPRSLLPAGKGHLSISVLFSPPRQHKQLFPWSHLDDPRSIASGSKPYPANNEAVQTWEEMIFFHAEWRTEDDDADDSRMICAIEAYNYTLPDHGSGVFYLSKLDTTGYSPRFNNPRLAKHLSKHDVPFVPSRSDSTSFSTPQTSSTSTPSITTQPTSLTTQLTISFLSYFMRLKHHPRLPTPSRPLRHMSIHILARAQGAYLFPNSPDNPAKKPLSDSKLVIWWREVLSRVIENVKNREWDAKIDARYMIPGLDAFESHPLVPLPPKAGDTPLVRAGWKYGHPYSLQGAGVTSNAELPPLPLHLDPSSSSSSSSSSSTCSRSLANLIPHFEDDPQSRFLDELAEEGQEPGRYANIFNQHGSATNGKAKAETVNGSSQVGVKSTDTSSQTPVPSTCNRSTSPVSRLSPRNHKRRLESVDREADAAGGAATRKARGESTSPRKSRRPRTGTDSPLGREGPALAVVSTPEPRQSPLPTQVPPIRRSPRKSSIAASTPRPVEQVEPRKRSVSPTKPVRPATPRANSGTPHVRLTSAQTSALRGRLALDNVSPDEFWVRMGFRQECSSGNLVGAFFLSATFDRNSILLDEDQSKTEDVVPARPYSPTLSTRLIPGSSSRPRFTIPKLSLYKSMRNNLQLDDCYWNHKRESIELTQEFDEQRGRMLLQFGSLEEFEKNPTESGYDEDITITLHNVRGLSFPAQHSCSGGRRLLRKTRAKQREKQQNDSNTVPNQSSSSPPHLQRLSPLTTEEIQEEERMQREYLVGKGVVWQTIPVQGYDFNLIQDAKNAIAKEDEIANKKTPSTQASTNGGAPITMLAVKRKKKPTASG
ncbi:unnamed protein product [Sympodiomycopsis kandeliae]